MRVGGRVRGRSSRAWGPHHRSHGLCLLHKHSFTNTYLDARSRAPWPERLEPKIATDDDDDDDYNGDDDDADDDRADADAILFSGLRHRTCSPLL